MYLNMLYPLPILMSGLCRIIYSIDPTYDITHFTQDILYFRDMGWVEFSDDKKDDEKTIKLTVEGKDIAECVEADTI